MNAQISAAEKSVYDTLELMQTHTNGIKGMNGGLGVTSMGYNSMLMNPRIVTFPEIQAMRIMNLQ